MTFRSDVAVGTRALARRPMGTSSVTAQLSDSLKPAAEVLSRLMRSQVTNRIWKLATREENWDGHGSAAPNALSVPRAAALAEELISALARHDLDWVHPHAGLDENGDVVLEWWKADRKLTIYVQPDTVEYIKSWGADIENQMDSGQVGELAFVNLWEWLQSSKVE